MRASTPFRYGAAGKAFVLGEPMLDRPHPRTAQSYRRGTQYGLAMDRKTPENEHRMDAPQILAML